MSEAVELSTSRIERFEDLVAWRKARELTRRVYAETRHGEFSRDRGLATQAQRAAVSIMANIAEGFERGRPAEFHQFLSVAKASCGELRSHLYVALDAGYLDRPTFESFMSQSAEVGRVIGGLRLSVAERKNWDEPNHESASFRERSFEYSALDTQYSELDPQHPGFGTQNSVLSTQTPMYERRPAQ